ncbi:D-lactate dehydrogenase [Flavobacterium micromati]|uniref:D-lactate dehydrogenase n=1 Tax=Flavobacterium micromati TaxID=229205 RepID=A0A1M5MTC0_9FLAO|nr:2-hydroxyacid dehydrogenase [Flavobacterium micromati]SHG80159.1 D-lactate dehydrogenase [Flavobacterium micromati]
MKVAIFSIHSFDRPFFEKIKTNSHELVYFKEQLSAETAYLAKDFDGIAIFTSDSANEEILNLLHSYGVKFIALRSVGYDHVDIDKATELKIKVANVPEYSPFAIAEHTVAMILALNRKLILADNRIKRHDFSLGGLTGFDLNGKTVGIIGTGKIGSVLAKILHGFGCKVIAYDKIEESSLKSKYALHYTNLDELCKQSDIISLNLPLNKDTKYLINEQQITIMKNGVMLINTARGGIVNTQSVINALKSGKISSFGMDVYENEKGVFFHDLSKSILEDDTLALLTTFSNVLITAHQSFLTNEALDGIVSTTIKNIDQWQKEGKSVNDIN